MAEQPADAVGRRVARPAGVDDERAAPGPSEHECGAEAGGATADDDAVPDRFHAPSIDGPRAMWQPVLPCRQRTDDVDARVRRRLRELRTASGMTLQQVAAAAHIDVSTLSRLETGKRRLALDHIPALAGGPRREHRRAARSGAAAGPAGARQAAPVRRDDDVAADEPRPGAPACTPTASRSAPAARRPPAELPVHDGHDWLYVLDGRLRLLLGDDDLTIEPGRGRRVRHTTPHWFGAVDGPVVLIGIFGAHGERAHLDG